MAKGARLIVRNMYIEYCLRQGFSLVGSFSF